MDRMWRHCNFYSLVMSMKNDATTLSHSLVGPQNVKHSVTMWSSNSTPGYISKKNEKLVDTKICIWIFLIALFIIVKK